MNPDEIRERESAALRSGLFRSLTDIASDERTTEGVLTGLPLIDKLTGGLRPGKLNLVGAFSSHGKTSLMLSTGIRLLLNDNPEPWIFLTSDDSDDMVLTKIIAMYMGVSTDDVEEYGSAWRRKVARELEPWLIVASPQNGRSVYLIEDIADIFNVATEQFGRPPAFACFDYLSLLGLQYEGEGMANVVQKARTIKALIRQTSETVWLVGHQCKKAAGSECSALTLNHLEYGGHQEADGVVLGLRRRIDTVKMPDWELELEEYRPTTNVSVMKNKITGRRSPNPVGTPYVIDRTTGILREMTQEEESETKTREKGARAGKAIAPLIGLNAVKFPNFTKPGEQTAS